MMDKNVDRERVVSDRGKAQTTFLNSRPSWLIRIVLIGKCFATKKSLSDPPGARSAPGKGLA